MSTQKSKNYTVSEGLNISQTNLIGTLELLLREKTEVANLVKDTDLYIIGQYEEAVLMLQGIMNQITEFAEFYNDIQYYTYQINGKEQWAQVNPKGAW